MKVNQTWTVTLLASMADSSGGNGYLVAELGDRGPCSGF